MQGDFDFGDLFTQAARRVLPLAHAKGLGFVFDYRGRALRWRAGADASGEAVQRLFRAAVDILEGGFVFFTAQVSEMPGARCGVSVAAAASGHFAPPAVWQQVLGRLQLQGVERMGEQAAIEWRSARGRCPVTGGEVKFSLDENEGSLFSLELVLEPHLVRIEGAGAEPHAGGARAWLIGDADASVGSLERRLQRLGWATRQLPGVDAALLELQHMSARRTRPALVIVYPSGGTRAPDLQPLAALLPPGTQLVLATTSPGLPAQPGVDVRPQPFSPNDLREFTRRAAEAPHELSGQTRPAPLAFEQRKRALVVDDNSVNLMVAMGMLQVLGFEVDTACDGLEAIEHCMKLAPDLVLMDLHMPGMDGLEATRRLRLLQREGAIPAFPILASTADNTAQEACSAAGMDGHLPKPLDLGGLERQLRRLMSC